MNGEFFCKINKSAGRFAICEDFGRLNNLSAKHPELYKRSASPIHLEQIGNLTKAFFHDFQKLAVQADKINSKKIKFYLFLK